MNSLLSHKKVTGGYAVSVVVAVMVALTAALAQAAEVGTVAAVVGTAEIGRNGHWEPATDGAPVQVGDELRTGNPGRMRLVFQDDSVLNLGDDTTLAVDEQLFQQNEGVFRSTMKLLRGRVRALVSEYYGSQGASYEVETPTAVAGVRGTEFVVGFDPANRITQVFGVEGKVRVYSSVGDLARSVFVTSGELTTVSPSQVPTSPRRIEPQNQHRYMEGLDIVALGSRSLVGTNAVVQQHFVPAADRVPNAAAAPGKNYGEPQYRDVGSLLDQPPGVVEKTAGGASIRF